MKGTYIKVKNPYLLEQLKKKSSKHVNGKGRAALRVLILFAVIKQQAMSYNILLI